MIEKDLLQGAWRFDQQALAEIYDRYSPALYRYAMHLLGEAGIAEECVAETFSRFLAGLQHGNGPREHLQAYLYRIAHNWITDRYRSTSPVILPLEADLVADREEEPPQAAAKLSERQRLRSALDQLTPEQRQVVILKYIEEWGNSEIAAAMHKPVSAIKALQHRALMSLQKSLQSQEKSEE